MLARTARCRPAVRVAERVHVREIDDDEGQRLVRIIRRGTGSVVTWRRAQMVLLSAQGMPVAKIAEVTFTSTDRVRDVIHNFNADGLEALYPKYKGGRPTTFTLPEGRVVSTHKDLEDLPRPRLRGQEGPCRAPVCDRRRRGHTRRGRARRRSAWTSSGRSTSSPTPAGSGPSAARRYGWLVLPHRTQSDQRRRYSRPPDTPPKWAWEVNA
jgi:hypothetical protein